MASAHTRKFCQLASGRALQQGVADFLADGSYSAHLRRQHYRLLNALDRWPLSVNLSHPQGRLTLWAALPETVDTRALYSQALSHGIVLTPARCSVPPNTLPIVCA